jgi:hypothetical protein
LDVFPADGLQHDGVDVLQCGGGRFHLVEQVETVMLVRMIKEEGVCVFIVDIVNKGDTPQVGPWVLPPLEDCVCQHRDFGGCGIVEADLLVIIDCCVAGFNHLDSTKERVAKKGRDDVDAT